MAGERLLLVEYLEQERCRNDKLQYFPFYAALARQNGGEVCYLSYGTDYLLDLDDQFSGCYLVRLEGEDMESLVREVQEFRPTHILSSEKWVPEMMTRIAAIVPDALFLAFSEWLRRPVPGISMQELAAGTRKASDWSDLHVSGLGLWGMVSVGPRAMPFPWICPVNKPDQYLPDIPGDYATKMMNQRAVDTKAFIRIIGGHHCTSEVPFEGNKFLEGLDLTKWESRVGCTFCAVTGSGARTIRHVREPVEQAVRQLMRVLECVGTGGRNSCEYDIYDTHVFLQLERFFTILEEKGFPPGSFYFSPRVNDFLAQANELERVLPRLAKSGHKLHILRMGLENFSPAEQARFNKGISPEQQKSVIKLLRSLQERYKGVFYPKEFGIILFTPYTTLDDLQINVDKSREYGFFLTSFMVSSAMQLDAGTPMIDAVVRDGVHVTDWPEDMAFFYSTFIVKAIRVNQSYWRFLDPVVDVLFRTIARVAAYSDLDAVGPYFDGSEALYQACGAFYDGLEGGHREFVSILDTFIEACRRGAAPKTGEELLERAKGLLAEEAWRDHLLKPKANALLQGLVAGGQRPMLPDEVAFRSRLLRVTSILKAMGEAGWSPLPKWELATSKYAEEADGYVLRFKLRKGAQMMELLLGTRGQGQRGMAVTRHLRLSHGEATVEVGPLVPALKVLLAILERDLYGV